jgi:predicted transcriptional regulator
MTTKQKMIKAVQSLPKNASIEDAMEKLYFMAKIEKGLKQADSGEILSHQQAREKMGKWLE